MRIVSVLALLCAVLMASTWSNVSAHARLERADPAPDGAVAAPTEIRIWFTQELTLRGNDIIVMDSAGNRVDNMDARVDQADPDRKQLVASVQVLTDGAYTVTWTSSSAEDGHPGTDSYTFSVTGSGQAEPAPEGAACPLAAKDQV